jgi:hypothetical protein
MPKAERKLTAQVLYPIVAALSILQGGCLLAIAGACAGGAATGYFYCKGRIYRDYPAGLPDGRNATHAALNDLRFPLITVEDKDGKSFLVTKTSAGKKVRIYLDCLPSPIPAEGLVTRVSIRVATFGDESVSARILDQIAWRLGHAAPVVPVPPPGSPPLGPPAPIQQTSAVQPAFQTTEPPAAPQPVKPK